MRDDGYVRVDDIMLTESIRRLATTSEELRRLTSSADTSNANASIAARM